MDWSKAKNILIGAFLITNIILIIALINSTIYKNEYTSIDESFIENVILELNKKDIKVDADIPKKVPNLAYLTLRYETYDPFKMVKTMMKNEDYEILYSGNKIYFQSNTKTLGIENNNKLIYADRSRDKIYNAMTKSLSQNISENFLTEKGFNEDYELVSHNIESKTHILLYKPVYKEKIIENEEVYMKFEIDNTGIKRFDRTWIEIVRLKEQKMQIISSADSLLKLLSEPDVENKTIKKVELCYKFDGDSITTKESDATPAWRVVFDDNSIKILK